MKKWRPISYAASVVRGSVASGRRVKRVNDIKEENEEDEWMTVMRIDDYRRVR